MAVALLSACDGPQERVATPQKGELDLATLPVPAAPDSLASHLAPGPQGTLGLSWVEPFEQGHRLRYSLLDAGHWSEPMTVASGNDWFVNWADFPSVLALSDSTLAAQWLVRQAAGGHAYDVAVAWSLDGGQHWSSPLRPHDDGTATEHGFVSLFAQDGGIGVIWLDGRETAAGAGDHHGGDALHGTSLRAATVTLDGRLVDEAVIDELSCDCCSTDVANTGTGPIVVYRDRTATETRDISLARRVDGAWQAPVQVATDEWTIAGCPVNGPKVVSDGDHVAVAWFTAATDTARVRLARSADGGAHFSPAVDVVATDTSGHVGLAWLEGGAVAVSWTCAGPAATGSVCVRSVAVDSTLGPVQVLSGAANVPARSVPQLARHGNQLVASWTEADGKATRIGSVSVPIAAFD